MLYPKNMKTIVVNMHVRECDRRIDRASMFGNPYILYKDGSREEVIEKYRVWFYQMLQEEYFREAVQELKGKVLGCWCKPKACHGDVIVEYLEGVQIMSDKDTMSAEDYFKEYGHWPGETPLISNEKAMDGALSVNNPCMHKGIELMSCEICGYPDPSKTIAAMKDKLRKIRQWWDAKKNASPGQPSIISPVAGYELEQLLREEVSDDH